MRNASTVRAGVGAHLLLVDDNKDGLLVRKALLEEQGFLITTTTSAEDALEAFSKRKFDLIITDYRMPKMNGVELIRVIKSRQPEVPIILISGFADAIGMDEKSTGANMVINKGGHEITNLLRSVTRLLAPRVARRPPGSQTAARIKTKAKA